MKGNWILYNKLNNIKEKSQKFSLSPLTSVILCNRNINDDDSIKKILSDKLDDINNAKLLPDIDKASEILYKYIVEEKKIRIVGDYDIDGVCSTYILYDAISNISKNISYDIPDRVLDGYGINNSIIDKAINDKIDLIITCDNGISAGEQITYANKNGIEVIVTDHHDIGELPENASAIINPKRKDVECPYPFSEICGTVVAWKLIIRFFELYGEKFNVKNFNPIDDYLEFAMIATIGDIMPLVDENHIIAKLGLKKILHTKNKGLKKLLDVTGIDFESKGITAFHIGFIIGPLINAAGRMDKATLALKLFISDSENEISDLANGLRTLNDERKQMTEKGVKLAIAKIEKDYINDKILVVFVQGLGEQVAGIVAGRIKDKYNKPTIIITDTFGENEAKASCRSIDAYDIFENLNKHKDLFLRFGGHKLAAGFSIDKNNIDILRTLLNKECTLSDKDFLKNVYIDAEFPFFHFDESIINDVGKLEPFGQGFTRPTFATRDVNVKLINIYGVEKNIIRIELIKDNEIGKAVIFTDSNEFLKEINRPLDIAYYPKINTFRGMNTIEFTVQEYRQNSGNSKK